MALPKPFIINIPQDALADLQQRLQHTRLPDHIPGTDWDMGTEPSYLQVQLACSSIKLKALVLTVKATALQYTGLE